jgi:hypothetical protein
MKDPERLLRRPPSELTGALLRAGADEKPSASSLRRALRVAAVGGAIGATTGSASAAVLGAKSGLAGLAGGSAATGTGAAATAATAAGIAAASASTSATAGAGAATAATITAAAIAKWVGVGAIGGVVAATAAHRVAPGVYEPLAPPAQKVEAPAKPPAPPAHAKGQLAPGVRGAFTGEPAAPAEAPLVTEAQAAASAAVAADRLPVSKAAPAALRERAPALATNNAVAAPPPVLAAEVAFVDRGRAAVQRGDSSGALQLLAGYEAAFPKQQLSPEVLFLRMEALSQSGDRERARMLARQIVARGATGPQAARARELLER